MWLGVVLLAAGLSGHLLAARAIGGYYLAYKDHILGFVLLTIVTGAIIAPLGWRFWKGRHDITVLALGAVQAIIGLVIYVNRFHIP
jgi:heme/copper-type cytochrome/quinol oxidase subunit 4